MRGCPYMSQPGCRAPGAWPTQSSLTRCSPGSAAAPAPAALHCPVTGPSLHARGVSITHCPSSLPGGCCLSFPSTLAGSEQCSLGGGGLLTWLGVSGQLCLGALLGGLQQDLPHLQTDTWMSASLKAVANPASPPQGFPRTQRGTGSLAGASPEALSCACCGPHGNAPRRLVLPCCAPSGSESDPGVCGSGAACALPAPAHGLGP